MYYEVNVSLQGQHLFATAERSIQSVYALRRALPIIAAKFPESEGYELTVTQFHTEVLQLDAGALLEVDS